MTAIAANDCVDGVALAGDCMMSIGNLVSRPTSKLSVHDDGIGSPTILGLAGDQGLDLRFKSVVNKYPNLNKFKQDFRNFNPPIESCLHYPEGLSRLMTGLLKDSGMDPVNNPVDFSALLGYTHGVKTYCCAFGLNMQPIPLDVNNYYYSIGSGADQALPALRELDDARHNVVGTAVHSKRGLTPPDYGDGCLMSYWAIHRTLRTAPAWVGLGIDMLGLVEKTDDETGATIVEVDVIDEARMDIYNMQVEAKEQQLM